MLAPGWLDHSICNDYYKTDEEFLFALAEAVGAEYRAVVAAGFVPCRSTIPAFPTGAT